ncbi:histidinol-phosphatase [Lysobacter soyae]|jgi:imidazoleglycerol-phosphate dehydratase/histidinol-phosphatase|uniref:D,D-heptose 1,7-bisphosphate phosphatase n=1 Tax=Lysobacter soyae TaxID=2764185 RepID=A0ABX8WQN1_9GAMM|nr:histidinol-phosphatase [Lysobacter sp. CJ11]
MTPTPILFVDRDGTLVAEPDDFQIDSFQKLRFVEGCIPALLRLRDAGYEFVMVTNQNGLGTPSFPWETFNPPHNLMMQVFESQGLSFREVLIDCSFAHDPAPTRKPEIGLVTHYVGDPRIDWTRSAMVGDRDTDVQFAGKLGIRGLKLKSQQFGDGLSWAEVADALV